MKSFDDNQHSLTAKEREKIYLVGLATFFFGFGAGALLNLYLLAIHSPLLEFRSSLTYKSAVFGDGIILPLVNMLAASVVLRYKKSITRKALFFALVSGSAVAVYFHVNQAVNNLVNWAMPTAWHWNILGLWHALYMVAVSSFLSLFYIVVLRYSKKSKQVGRDAVLVTLGLIIFFILLHLDYTAVSPSNLVPHPPSLSTP